MRGRRGGREPEAPSPGGHRRAAVRSTRHRARSDPGRGDARRQQCPGDATRPPVAEWRNAVAGRTEEAGARQRDASFRREHDQRGPGSPA